MACDCAERVHYPCLTGASCLSIAQRKVKIVSISPLNKAQRLCSSDLLVSGDEANRGDLACVMNNGSEHSAMLCVFFCEGR